MSEDPRYDGEPVRCRCGQHHGARWRWWDEGKREDAHWWIQSCWRCCEIARMRLEMTTARVRAEVGPQELLRRIVIYAFSPD